MNQSQGTTASPSSASARKAPGLTIAAKLILAFTGLIAVLGVLLVMTYLKSVPGLVEKQVDLRVESITKSFASAALPPVVEKNYLRINKIAEATAALPDVAYAAAVNDKGIAVAGIFGDLGRFDAAFAAKAKEGGFPAELLEKNRIEGGASSARKVFSVGGQPVVEYAIRLENTGSEVRVGLFTSGIEGAVREAVKPLVLLLAAFLVVGVVVLFLVAKTVSAPIHELSAQVERISMGDLDQEIGVKAGGEVWQLAEAFKRMQKSLKYSMNALRKTQGQ